LIESGAVKVQHPQLRRCSKYHIRYFSPQYISHTIFIDNDKNIVKDINVLKNIVNDIKTAIRQRRRNKGISQAELGRTLGMTQAQIARIEGKRSDVRLSTLTEVARALGLEPLLVPQTILPAIQHLIAQQERTQTKDSAVPRRLFGNEPEDADEESSQ
jgi:transcriptional regulator with XRE-family HTH domain